MFDTLEQGKWYYKKGCYGLFYNYIGRPKKGFDYHFHTINKFGYWDTHIAGSVDGSVDVTKDFIEVVEFTELKNALMRAEEHKAFRDTALDMLPKNNVNNFVSGNGLSINTNGGFVKISGTNFNPLSTATTSSSSAWNGVYMSEELKG